MSAYIVSTETIDCLVRAAVTLGGRDGFRWTDRGRDGKDCQRLYLVNGESSVGSTLSEADLGQLLLEWNRASVQCRYGEPIAGIEYDGPEPNGATSLMNGERVHDTPPLDDVLGCLRCLEYQSCEHPTYDIEPGAFICRAIERLVLNRLADLHLGEQPWGLSPRSVGEEVKS